MGAGYTFVDSSLDYFTNSNIPMRYYTAFYGGTDPQFTLSSTATFPVRRLPAVTADKYYYEFPGAIDISNLGDAYPVIIRDATLGSTLNRVTATPASGEYRIVLDANWRKRTTIEFHSDQAGHAIDYDLFILGSTITAAEWNDINVNTVTGREGLITKYSTANVTNPPTKAELESEFGSASTQTDAFMAILDDNGAGTNVYLITKAASDYYYQSLTKAV
jgi:hypothetical protein